MKQDKSDILEATLKYAKINGWHKTSIREVSKEIGYSTIKIYSEFGNKENLLISIQDKGFRLLRDEYIKAIAYSENVEEQLLNICLTHYRFAHQNSEYYELMFNSNEAFCKKVSLDTVLQAAEPIKSVLEAITNRRDITDFLHWFSLVHGYYEVTKQNFTGNWKKGEVALTKMVNHFIKGIQ